MPAYSHYTGRFAPSPSGPLHFGSLIAAVGSYLQARKQDGRWLVRIEDIDPPREVAGAASAILTTLEAHGLHWDESVSYQSQHSQFYDDALTQLNHQGLSYYCRCTRAQIRNWGGHYPGACRHRTLSAQNSALRFYNRQPQTEFTDDLLGKIEIPEPIAQEDFIVRRKDGLYAYQLAVVVDDIRQGITQVVRGADLLETTVSQIALYRALGATPPAWLHLPVASIRQGFKLSKQNHAPALLNHEAMMNLHKVLVFLGMHPGAVSDYASPAALLEWAVANWSVTSLPKCREILI